MRLLVASYVLLLAGCVEEPTPREAESATSELEKDAAKDAVKQRQMSIEEAAEEATKLIEADAKSEVDEIVNDSISK